MPEKGPDVAQRGAGVAAKHLADMGKRARDVRPVDPRIWKIYLQAEAERFDNPSAARWKKLAPATVAKKSRMQQDPRVLRVSGALRDSLAKAHAPHQIHAPAKDAFRFGTSLHYARFHHQGEGVPKRLLIAWTSIKKRDDMTEAIADYLARESRRPI